VVAAQLQVEARNIRVRKKLMILPRKWKNLPQNQTFKRLLSPSQVYLTVLTVEAAVVDFCTARFILKLHLCVFYFLRKKLLL
jgi:hypothetical protein